MRFIACTAFMLAYTLSFGWLAVEAANEPKLRTASPMTVAFQATRK